MNTSLPAPSLPPPLFDTLLQRTPVDVLLFDTALVCRYAAPADDTLFGRTADELVGRHAAEILPPAANGLRPVLERAAQEAAAWRAPHYRFTYRERDTELSFCWAIRVEPIAVEQYRGVLVTLSDVYDLIDENDQLRAENDRLHAELEQAHRRESAWVTALRGLQATVRSRLAPVSGYLQVLARRPSVLAGRAVPSVIEDHVLPQLRNLVDAVDRLSEPPSSQSLSQDAE